MPMYEKYLFTKTSTLPGAGKGLFTSHPILRGARVIEYIGRMTTWKEADHRNGANGYIYYINSRRVIDALPYKKSMARYANDARGLTRISGLRNNCFYKSVGRRVYIVARNTIPAGSELLVGYGREYWEAI